MPGLYTNLMTVASLRILLMERQTAFLSPKLLSERLKTKTMTSLKIQKNRMEIFMLYRPPQIHFFLSEALDWLLSCNKEW
eukprot:scaffold116543_cov61-Attheya_sp.AAC.1